MQAAHNARQMKMIVYNIPKHAALDIIANKKYFLLVTAVCSKIILSKAFIFLKKSACCLLQFHLQRCNKNRPQPIALFISTIKKY